MFSFFEYIFSVKLIIKESMHCYNLISVDKYLNLTIDFTWRTMEKSAPIWFLTISPLKFLYNHQFRECIYSIDILKL